MIVWSWIDWHVTMEANPYVFAGDRKTEQAERFRLYVDLGIVGTYAYILFQVEPLAADPEANLKYLLVGYPLVFAMYLTSGVLRRVRHGSRATNLPPIVVFFVAFLVWTALYVLLRRTTLSEYWLNLMALTGTLLGMRAYRWYRKRYRERRGA